MKINFKIHKTISNTSYYFLSHNRQFYLNDDGELIEYKGRVTRQLNSYKSLRLIRTIEQLINKCYKYEN